MVFSASPGPSQLHAGHCHAKPIGAKAGWTAVAIFLLINTVAYLDRQLLTLLVDPIKASLNVSDFRVSMLQGAAFVLFYSICGLPIGWAVDRYSRRWIIFLGMAFWSILASAGGLAKTYWQLLWSRIGVGVGEASLHPSVYSLLSDFFNKDHLTGALAVYSTGAAVGGGIALAMGGAIVEMAAETGTYHSAIFGEIRPWQMALIITGLFGMVIALAVFLVPEPPRRGRLAGSCSARGLPTGSVLAFMSHQRGFYIAHFLGFAIFAMIGAGFSSWMPTYLMRTFHWPVARTGLTLGALSLVCMTSGMLFAGYFCDRWMSRGVRDAHFRYYVYTLAIFAVAGIIACTSVNIVLVVICIGIVKFMAFIPVAAGAIQLTTPNEYRGQITAAFLLIYNVLGFGVGPSLVAGLSDFVLRGPSSIGTALAILFATLPPIIIVLFAFGMKPLRCAVEAAENWNQYTIGNNHDWLG
jgi:MFS family permease